MLKITYKSNVATFAYKPSAFIAANVRIQLFTGELFHSLASGFHGNDGCRFTVQRQQSNGRIIISAKYFCGQLVRYLGSSPLQTEIITA